MLNMSAVSRLLLRLEQKALAAENLIVALRNELSQLEKTGVNTGSNKIVSLKQENETLKSEVESLKLKILENRSRQGVRCFSTSAPAAASPSAPVAGSPSESKSSPSEDSAPKKIEKKQEKPKNAGKGKSQEKSAQVEDDAPVDIGRIDLRIGKIIGCKKHPDADSLYVEEVDVGEEKPRTIVSGLVKHVELADMQNRIAIFMCNLKPAKMRGVLSEGMLMCASSPDKVEILLPPANAVPGDCVEVEGYVRRPDAVLNPKKKIWESVAPDLKVDGSKQATYKGVVLTIPGKGSVTSPSLINVQIK